MTDVVNGRQWLWPTLVFAGVLLVEWGLPDNVFVSILNRYILLPYGMLLGAAYIREVGRVVAGAFVGLQFQEMRVHGFVVRRSSDGFRVLFSDWYPTSHSFSVPVGLANLRSRILVMILGGPIASFLMTAFALWMGSRAESSLPWLLWAGFNAVIGVLGSFQPWGSFHPSDADEIAFLRGNSEQGREYLAWHVWNAVGIEDADREKYFDEAGFAWEAALVRFNRHRDGRDIELVLKALDEARRYAPRNPKIRFNLDCFEATFAAFDRWDVERSRRALPSEEDARAVGLEDRWLFAAIRVALAERRWGDAVPLCTRLVAILKDQGGADEEWVNWVKVVRRWAARKAARAVGTDPRDLKTQ